MAAEVVQVIEIKIINKCKLIMETYKNACFVFFLEEITVKGYKRKREKLLLPFMLKGKDPRRFIHI